MAFPPTDWGGWTPEEYEVGAPATSNHFERWFRNVVAALQGSPGAPRVQPKALASNLAASGLVNSTTNIAISDANLIKTLRASFSGSGSPRVSFSTDGGASFGAWTLLAANISWGEFEIDLVSGQWVGTHGVVTFGTSPGISSTQVSGTISIPSGMNVFRFGNQIGNNSTVFLTIEGGRDDV